MTAQVFMTFIEQVLVPVLYSHNILDNSKVHYDEKAIAMIETIADTLKTITEMLVIAFNIASDFGLYPNGKHPIFSNIKKILKLYSIDLYGNSIYCIIIKIQYK